MQLVEVDDVHGVRAAVVTFASDASSLRFVLVPISPLGEPAHYEALREMLRSCDLVVTEGPRSGQPGMGKLRDLEWNPQWHRIGRGRHLRLDTPPDSWEGVDRPFITAPSGATDRAASRAGRPPPKPLWLVPLEPLRPLVAMITSRYVTRVLMGHSLAEHARQALGPNPWPGFIDADARYRADRLSEVVRELHAKRHGQTLRVAVVAGVGELARVARTLGGLGYSPDEVDWTTVFRWLPGDNPSEGPRPWIERILDKPRRTPKAWSRADRTRRPALRRV
jgi:hypothetical protein